MLSGMEERRRSPRKAARLPVTAEAGGRVWSGTILDFSPEGALVCLEGTWDGDRDLILRLDPALTWEGFTAEARLVRAHSPDGRTTLLAVRFF